MNSFVKHLTLSLAFLEVPARLPAQSVAELKASIDSLRAEVVQLRAGIESRLPPNGRTVPEYVNSVISAATGAGVGNVVNGDLTVNGRVCLPTCRSDVPAAIQIRSQNEAEIALESNLDHTNEQGVASHAAMISFASDGGFRLIHNYMHVKDPEGGWRGAWIEPEKPRTILGFDSQGTTSLSQDKNGYIYPSQSLIVNFHDQSKTIRLQSMKAGWKWRFCESPSVDNNCSRVVFPSGAPPSIPLPSGSDPVR